MKHEDKRTCARNTGALIIAVCLKKKKTTHEKIKTRNVCGYSKGLSSLGILEDYKRHVQDYP